MRSAFLSLDGMSKLLLNIKEQAVHDNTGDPTLFMTDSFKRSVPKTANVSFLMNTLSRDGSLVKVSMKNPDTGL